jgi:hypothetical protein
MASRESSGIPLSPTQGWEKLGPQQSFPVVRCSRPRGGESPPEKSYEGAAPTPFSPVTSCAILP